LNKSRTYKDKRHIVDHKANKTKSWLNGQALDSSKIRELLAKKPCDITRSQLGLTA